MDALGMLVQLMGRWAVLKRGQQVFALELQGRQKLLRRALPTLTARLVQIKLAVCSSARLERAFILRVLRAWKILLTAQIIQLNAPPKARNLTNWPLTIPILY